MSWASYPYAHTLCSRRGAGGVCYNLPDRGTARSGGPTHTRPTRARRHFERTTPSLFSMLAAAGRIILVVNGLLLAKIGVEYMRGVFAGSTASQLPTLSGLFLPSVFYEGSTLALLLPFLSCTYMTVSGLNILAAATFGSFEAASVLLLTGIVFHAGMAAARLNVPAKLAALYQPGKQAETSTLQFAVGGVCIVGAAMLYASRRGRVPGTARSDDAHLKRP
jgi:hypothetical protein